MFSDIGFVRTLAMNGVTSWKRPTSPFVPTLSLFFASLEKTWTENNAQNVIAPAETVAILANTLESYPDTDKEESEESSEEAEDNNDTEDSEDAE